MLLNSFYYALSLLETLFGINISEDKFEEIAIIAWNLIGNKIVKLYRYKVHLDNCTTEIELPCNCDILEAVTNDLEEWNYTTNDTPNGDLNSAFTEAYIEHRKLNSHPLYINGQFIKYERVGNTLYLNQPYNNINILYKGIILDDNGLPQITDKEALAIATFCAYTIKYKEGIMTNNPNLIRLAESIRAQWLIRADQARIDYTMSQNEWDEVLDAKNSWNRKSYGKSLKLYK